MRGNETFYLLFGLCGFMFGLLTWTYDNLEYKGYPSISSCTGECYEEYLKEHGNILEQLEQKKQEAEEQQGTNKKQ